MFYHCKASQTSSIAGKHGAQLVNLLLMNGAKANVSDKLGRTPLHSAALLGNEEAVQALLKAGAHVDSHFQVNSRPKQQLDNHSILHSDYSVDVECKEVTSRFNVSRTGDSTTKAIFTVYTHIYFKTWYNYTKYLIFNIVCFLF